MEDVELYLPLYPDVNEMTNVMIKQPVLMPSVGILVVADSMPSATLSIIDQSVLVCQDSMEIQKWLALCLVVNQTANVKKHMLVDLENVHQFVDLTVFHVVETLIVLA